jgi:hypothetical protein
MHGSRLQNEGVQKLLVVAVSMYGKKKTLARVILLKLRMKDRVEGAWPIPHLP